MAERIEAREAVGDGSVYAKLSADKRAVVDEVLAATSEALRHLKEMRPGRTPPHLFLAPLLDQLKAFEAAARYRPVVAEHLHDPAREAVRSMLQAFGRDGTAVDRVAEFVDIAPAQAAAAVPPAGDLFSLACKRYVGTLSSRETMAEKDVQRYEKMLRFFCRLAGDRAVGAYRPADIAAYVARLRTLPTRFSPDDVPGLGEVPSGSALLSATSLKSKPKSTLSIGTIASYLAPVRSVFTHECLTLQISNPCNGIKVEKPGKNRPSRTRPIPIEILNRTIEIGCAEATFAAVVMPVLALLTARRIGLLTYLNRDWIEKIGDYYIVRPTKTVMLPDRTRRTPIKTDESFTPFALHEELVGMGLLDLMEERGFLFAEALATDDPPAALSKRMNALLKRAGARGRAQGQTFHALRARGIVHYRAHVPQAVRLQAGHAVSDEHEAYDWAEIEPELVPMIASVPLPKGLDLSPIRRVSWPTCIALERRLLSTGNKRREQAIRKEAPRARGSNAMQAP